MSIAKGKASGAQQKERGNQLFAQRKYEQALACYTEAIVSDTTD